jgi:hypothetical protein
MPPTITHKRDKTVNAASTYIVGDDDHGRLLGLDKAGDVVDAALDALVLGLSGGSTLLGLGLAALILLLLRLAAVLVEHLEEVSSCIQKKLPSMRTQTVPMTSLFPASATTLISQLS